MVKTNVKFMDFLSGDRATETHWYLSDRISQVLSRGRPQTIGWLAKNINLENLPFDVDANWLLSVWEALEKHGIEVQVQPNPETNVDYLTRLYWATVDAFTEYEKRKPTLEE